MTWKHLEKKWPRTDWPFDHLKSFSDCIQTEFGLDKFSKATFKQGKLTTTENIQIDLDTTIQQLEHEGT